MGISPSRSKSAGWDWTRFRLAPPPTRSFCRGVVNVVAPLVPAVKPQAAFFEELGPEGMAALGRTIDYCHEKKSVGDPRWQTERHRLDGRGLRPGDSRSQAARAHGGRTP